MIAVWNLNAPFISYVNSKNQRVIQTLHQERPQGQQYGEVKPSCNKHVYVQLGSVEFRNENNDHYLATRQSTQRF